MEGRVREARMIRIPGHFNLLWAILQTEVANRAENTAKRTITFAYHAAAKFSDIGRLQLLADGRDHDSF
jgi:hypothetical protein